MLYIWMLLISINGVSQDMSSFGKTSAYGLSGSVNLGFNFYIVSGDRESVYAPTGYMASGVISARLGGITVPVLEKIERA